MTRTKGKPDEARGKAGGKGDARPARATRPGNPVARAAPAPKKPEKKPAKSARAEASPREDRGKRLLDLVVLLVGARAPVSYREIRAQFKAYRTENEEAGLRAFERDKAELLELGLPLRYVTPEDDDSFDEPGYVVDHRRIHLPEIRLSPEEVASLVLAGSVARAAAGTTYDEVVDVAIKKLAFDLPRAPDTPAAPPPRRDPVLVHFPRPAGEGHEAERLADLEQAIRFRKRVTLDYANASTARPGTRDVDPYGLAYRQGTWLLVGWCHLRGEVRSFRLDRILRHQVAPKPKTPDFERPADFDVRGYADRSPWSFRTADPAPVELLIRPAAAAMANEDFGPGAKTERRTDGAVVVRFTCTNPDYLVARVLAAKGAISVTAPPELRARVREELDAVLARYAPHGGAA